MTQWNGSEYVLSNSSHRYVVNRALASGATRVNVSFGDANTFLYFNERKRRVELRLAVDLSPGFYEAFFIPLPIRRRRSGWRTVLPSYQ